MWFPTFWRMCYIQLQYVLNLTPSLLYRLHPKLQWLLVTPFDAFRLDINDYQIETMLTQLIYCCYSVTDTYWDTMFRQVNNHFHWSRSQTLSLLIQVHCLQTGPWKPSEFMIKRLIALWPSVVYWRVSAAYHTRRVQGNPPLATVTQIHVGRW